ncbi:MAG TPA: hypothetical protein PLF31_02205 [Candidatus Paceibacterota bacterium]|nr:hypothetical protein [Candidatus Paceibacterota bacterium]
MCAQERVDHAIRAMDDGFVKFLDESPEWKNACEQAKLACENAPDPVSKSKAEKKLRRILASAHRAYQSWLTQA